MVELLKQIQGPSHSPLYPQIVQSQITQPVNQKHWEKFASVLNIYKLFFPVLISETIQLNNNSYNI